MRLAKLAARCFALLSASLLAWSTQASVITVSSNISNMFIGEASSTVGTFDINSSVAALGFNAPLSVTSATMSLLFTDNGDGFTDTSYFVGSTLVRLPDTCGSTLGSCVQHYKWLDRYNAATTNPFETASVTVGDQTAFASSTYTESISSPYETPLGTYSCGTFGCGFTPMTRPNCGTTFGVLICTGPWPVVKQTVNFYESGDGDFSINLTLDGAALLDLGNDGLLDFTLGSFAGNFNFLSASLTADITEQHVVVTPDPPTGVPEPAAPAMLFAGLISFAVCRRARRGKRA